MKKKTVLYLNYTSILTQGILLSQVVIPLKKLAARGYRIILVSGERSEDLKKRKEREALHNELESAGVELVFFRKTLRPYLRMNVNKSPSPFLNGICFLFDLVRFFFMTGWWIISRRCGILHARSYVPAAVGLFYQLVFRVVFIFDPRGILPEELRLARGWGEKNWRYRFWKILEKIILKRADYVFALSRPFRKHLKEIVPRKDILLTPCCIDPQRFGYEESRRAAMRSKLGFQNRFILVYSIGSFVPYQALERAVHIFSLLQKEKPDSQFLILTPDSDSLKQYAEQYGINLSGVSVVRVPFSLIPDYLMASDAGLLARHPSEVSRVASPVKFPEYLGCGLPVLAFSGIGDTEYIIRRYNVGECVDPDDDKSVRTGIQKLISRIEGYREGLRAQCREVAEKYYSWNAYLPVYQRIYDHARHKTRKEKISSGKSFKK
ncbi:glycosyltransferase family 4 protein [Candidatus Sumerlaeota bacterium]|nr:glycosyltransferase family 4 protein [Candidatus Sumerlaeota bacterium]